MAAFALFAFPDALSLGYAAVLVLCWLGGAAAKAEVEHRLAGEPGPIRLWPGGSLGWPGQRIATAGELKLMAGGNAVLFLLLGLGVLSSVTPLVEAQIVLLAANWCLPVYPADLARLIAVVTSSLSQVTAARIAAVISGTVGVVILTLPRLLPGLAQMENRFQPFDGIVAVWCFLNAAWLLTAAEQGTLRQHPQFAQRSRLRAVPRQDGRRCPGCRRELPPAARMCGYCERFVEA